MPNVLSSSVQGISQTRILEWVAISYSRASSRPRDQTHVSCTGRGTLAGLSLPLSHPGNPLKWKTWDLNPKSYVPELLTVGYRYFPKSSDLNVQLRHASCWGSQATRVSPPTGPVTQDRVCSPEGQEPGEGSLGHSLANLSLLQTELGLLSAHGPESPAQ